MCVRVVYQVCNYKIKVYFRVYILDKILNVRKDFFFFDKVLILICRSFYVIVCRFINIRFMLLQCGYVSVFFWVNYFKNNVYMENCKFL